MALGFRFQQTADELRKKELLSTAENYETMVFWCFLIGGVLCGGTLLSIGYRYYMHKRKNKSIPRSVSKKPTFSAVANGVRAAVRLNKMIKGK